MRNQKASLTPPEGSVRITLRITEKCNDDILWLANYYGITQKDLFDRLVRELRSWEEGHRLRPRRKLDNKATEKTTEEKRIRKAQVVSRQAYRTLNSYSKRYAVSRDDIVNFIVPAVRFTAGLQLKESAIEHKEALDILENFSNQAEEVREQLFRLLGSDDPITLRFFDVINILNDLHDDISSELKEGIPVKTC